MSISIKSTLTGLSVVLVLAMSGCSESDKAASFVYSDATTSLMVEAQNGVVPTDEDGNPQTDADGNEIVVGVKGILDTRFGTPQDLSAWMALPIDFGGTVATIATGEESVKITELKIAQGSDAAIELKAGDTVQFLTGACAETTPPLSAVIESWNSETGTIVLQGELVANSAETNGDDSVITVAEGDQIVINGGSHLSNGRALYMRHCSHCHGTSGDGAGPTAEYLYPRPRDYRHGVFKFTSTTDASKVSRDDLKRVLKYGIPGTYMPSFLLLDDSELDQLVEYVRFLAMRGEFERKLSALLKDDFGDESVRKRIADGDSTRDEILTELQEFLGGYFKDDLNDETDFLIEGWANADLEDAKIVPNVPRVPDSPESRRRGRELYLGKTLNCADCHGAYALGNGPQTVAFEKNPITQEVYGEPGLHDVWDNLNQPRNLTHGIYRGGRRPIDLFCRIHAGIKGSRMPSFKNTPHEDIWHVVNYVLSIPFDVDPGSTGTPAAPAADPAAADAAD